MSTSWLWFRSPCLAMITGNCWSHCLLSWPRKTLEWAFLPPPRRSMVKTCVWGRFWGTLSPLLWTYFSFLQCFLTTLGDASFGTSWLVAVGIMSRSFRDIESSAGKMSYPCWGLFRYTKRAKYGSSWLWAVVSYAIVWNSVSGKTSFHGSYDCASQCVSERLELKVVTEWSTRTSLLLPFELK